MFIAILTYKKPLSEVDKYLQAHRDFLARHYATGDLIASGPRYRRVGGVIMLRAAKLEDALALLEHDPFNINDIASYEVVEFTPTLFCNDALEAILCNSQ